MNLKDMKQQKGRWLMGFSMPAIIAMLLSAAVTVTDGYFTGNYVGKDGLAAVNLGLPIVYLMLACGLMTGVGGSVIAGILNGNGQKEKSRQVFNQTMASALLLSATISLLILYFQDSIQRFLGVDTTLADLFGDYHKVMLLYYPVMVLNLVCSMFVRAEGKPGFSMAVTLAGVIFNIVFNAVFLHLGLGIRGIAFSSVASGFLSLALNISFFIRSARIFRFEGFSFDCGVFRDTLLNGSSEFVGEMASCLSMYCYNLVIMRLAGADGVSAFAIAGYTVFVFSMIATGFGQGMCPLVSFSCGAGETVLAEDFRRLTCRTVFGTGMVFSVVMLTGVSQYSGLFVSSESVESLVREGVSILSLSFPVMGFNIIVSMYLTACGRALPSAIISVARGIVILLICIFTLPLLWGMKGVWLAAPLTEILTCILSILCLITDFHKSQTITAS